MKIVRDPDVYGVSAAVGVFITLDELVSVGALRDLERCLNKRINRAEERAEHYDGLCESGEATTSQQTRMMEWNEIYEKATQFMAELQEVKKRVAREKGQQVWN